MGNTCKPLTAKKGPVSFDQILPLTAKEDGLRPGPQRGAYRCTLKKGEKDEQPP
jgi:hypothetical protein